MSIETETIGIGELKPSDRNPRAHTPRAEECLVQSLQSVGPLRSIVVDENLKILAGHSTINACQEVGIDRIILVPRVHNAIYAVQVSGLTDAQKEEYTVRDNRASDLSGWDAMQLSHNASDFGFDLLNVGFNEAEISALADGAFQDALAANQQPGEKELQVLVTCKDAEQQSELMGRLIGEGFKCKSRRRKPGT